MHNLHIHMYCNILYSLHIVRALFTLKMGYNSKTNIEPVPPVNLYITISIVIYLVSSFMLSLILLGWEQQYHHHLHKELALEVVVQLLQQQQQQMIVFLWPLLLTWFNFNPSMDK